MRIRSRWESRATAAASASARPTAPDLTHTTSAAPAASNLPVSFPFSRKTVRSAMTSGKDAVRVYFMAPHLRGRRDMTGEGRRTKYRRICEASVVLPAPLCDAPMPMSNGLFMQRTGPQHASRRRVKSLAQPAAASPFPPSALYPHSLFRQVRVTLPALSHFSTRNGAPHLGQGSGTGLYQETKVHLG